MTRADRRFTAWLLAVFGPLFVAGGFLAAFTVEGALFVFTGLAMLVAGLLVFTRLPILAVIASGVAIFGSLTAWLAVELR